MSEIYLDEQSSADTPSSGEVVIYPKTDGKIYAKSDDGIEQTLTNLGTTSNIYALVYKNANYTLDIEEDVVVITYQTTDITITIPQANTIPNDGYGREFMVVNLSPAGSVTIQMSGSDTMSNGMTTMKVNYREQFRFAGAYPTLGQGWIRTNSLKRRTQVRRSSSWDDSNFDEAWASVPWQVEDINCDSNVAIWSAITNPSRITVKAQGRYDITAFGTYNSTGGGSWEGRIRLLKNGTTVIDGSEHYTSNYQREDSMIVLPKIMAVLDVDDYVETQLYHDNLTGNALNFMMSISTQV